MAVPLWTNDSAHGGTMFVVNAVSTYEGGVMLGGKADSVTCTATASAGTDTIGQHFPRMQLEIPSGTTAFFEILVNGGHWDDHSFVGPQTPAYMDYFNFDENNNEQNGLFTYALEDGDVVTIEAWSEHTNGDLTPLVDAEKAVLTIIDVGYTSTELPPVCAKPVSSLAGTDVTPLNPGNVTVVARTTSTNLGATITSETMTVVDGAVITPITMPIAGDRLDMSQWVGKTVTLHYSGEDSCGGGTASDEDILNVTVPAWAKVVTVDLTQPRTGNNYHAISWGLDALGDGGLLEVYPHPGGEYLMYNGLSGDLTQNRIRVGGGDQATGLRNSTVKFVGAVTINGNDGNGQTQNNAITFALCENVLFDGGGSLVVYNTYWSALVTNDKTAAPSTTIDCTIKDLLVRGGNRFGIQLNGCLRTVLEGITVEDMDQATSARGFELGNAVEAAQMHSCIAQRNKDGFRSDQQSEVSYFDCTSFANTRQGVLALDSPNFRWTRGEVKDNNQAGIQIENGSTNFIVRGAEIHGNNIYLGGGGGEVGLWVDDSTTGLLEDNIIYNNGGGIKIDSDSAFQTSNVIVRRNRVYLNSGPGAASGDLIAMMMRGTDKCHIYNNTFWQNGRVNAQGVNGDFIVLPEKSGEGQFNTNIAFRNNILGKTVRKNNDTMQVSLSVGDEFADMDWNVYFEPPANALDKGYEVAQVPMTFTEYKTDRLAHSQEQNTTDDDPLLSDTTHAPAAGSPILGASRKLTDITAINGLELDLALPGFFWVGDRIEFTDRTTAVITSVTTTSVFVDAVPASVAIGQDVDLYGLNNIGAVQ